MLQGKYPLLIALVLGLLAGIIAYSAIKAREKAVREGWSTRRILCAKIDIVEGSELDDEMMQVCEIPEKFVTDSFIVIPEGDEEGAPLPPYGQKVLVPLKQGDPILYSHFESRRDFTLSESIPTKARAIAIDVQEKSSVSGWIKPNDHVDVLGTFRDPEGKDMVTVTLLQNAIVLATGRISGMTTYVPEEDKKYNQVVLMALPEEAEILTLAAETGQLMLALRNPKDLDIDPIREKKTTPETLLTGERTKVLADQRVRTIQSTVEVIRGNSRNRESGGGEVNKD